jgi:hypothetical protein
MFWVPSSAPAAWARSIAPAIRGSTARWRSRCCRPDIAEDPGRLRASSREARAVAALSHPNVVSIHDVGVRRATVQREEEVRIS